YIHLVSPQEFAMAILNERDPPWYRHFYWRVPPWLTARAGQVIKRQSPLLPKAEIFLVPSNVRYWGQSGHGLLHCKCLLLTQSGHTSREQLLRNVSGDSNAVIMFTATLPLSSFPCCRPQRATSSSLRSRLTSSTSRPC